MDIDKLIMVALEKVDKKIEDSRISKCADEGLPMTMLFNIKLELEKMLAVLNKSKYLPSYPRFLLDYPENDLINFLLDVSYKYKKMT